MKTRLLITLLMAVLFVMPSSADDYTPAQKAFRSNLMSFLKDEGFSPFIDEDNSLSFKKEGILYWIKISEDSPFFIQFHHAGLDCSTADKKVALVACNITNRDYKCVKAMLYDDYVSIAVELFCHSVEEFKYTFYASIRSLESAYEVLQETYAELLSDSSSPFSISSVEIANTDVNGNIVNGYGTKIYSYQTKYLKPRVTCNVKTKGSYDIYVKFYKGNGTMSTGDSSPSGYSYKCTVNMEEGTHTYVLDGWGGKTAGFWSSGTYRFEFYYDGTKVGEKEIVVN